MFTRHWKDSKMDYSPLQKPAWRVRKLSHCAWPPHISCKSARNKSTKWNGTVQKSVHTRAKSFRSVPFYGSLFRAFHFSERNGTLRIVLVWTLAKNRLFFGPVPYRSVPFRTVPFSCERGLSYSCFCTSLILLLATHASPSFLKVLSLNFSYQAPTL